MTNPLPKDDLAGDLGKLWDEVFADQRITELATRKALYMQKATMYIVARDHKVWDHAYNLGNMAGQMKATNIYKLSPGDSKRVLTGNDNGQGIILKDKIEREK